MTDQNKAAAALTALIREVYGERIIAAAHIGDDACVAVMNDARDFLVKLLRCSPLAAANLVRGMQVTFCDDIGLAVPPEYRAGLCAALERTTLAA